MILSKEKVSGIDLDSIIDSYLRIGSTDKFLLIVPTNRKLRKLKKEFIDLSAGKSVSVLNIETLTTLSNKLLLLFRDFVPLSDASASILISQSAREVPLAYFKNYKDQIPFGTLEKIKNVISEYKRHGITPDILRMEAGKLKGSSRLKALDIAAIYENYLSKCGKLVSFEIGDVYKNLSEIEESMFLEGMRRLFPEIEVTVMEGFDEFTSLEIGLIDRISKLKSSRLFVRFDYYEHNDALFSHLDKCYAGLKSKGFQTVRDDSPFAADRFPDSVKSGLFKRSPKKRIGLFKENIFLIEGEKKEEEIELTAKRIKRLIVSDNVAPEKICVVINLIGNYSFSIRDRFGQLGIPYNLTDRLKLEESFPIGAIVNLLEIAETDFYFKSIFRAGSNRFLNLEEKINLSNLIRTARELKITIGFSNWESAILRGLAARDKFKNYGDEENRKFDNYEEALKDLRYLRDLVKPFLSRASLNDFKSHLIELIRSTGLHRSILKGPADRAEESIKAVSIFLETIDEVFALLNSEYGEGHKFDISEILLIIKTICRWTRFNVKERSGYGVQITTLEEVRGLKFDHLFICGLNDSVFPTRYSPEIFYSGSFRKHERIHQLEERYRFYQTLLAWEKELYLSYSRTDSRQELVVSSFLLEFLELFDVTGIEKSDFDSAVYSDFEFLAYLGMKKGKIDKSLLKEKDLNLLDHILNAIEVSKIRESNPLEPSSFNGFLLAGKNPELEKSLKIASSKEFSISELEIYAKCPFKYFIERILRLEEYEEPVEEIEALELGSLLHAILYKFYTEVRKKSIDLTDLSADGMKKVRKILFEIGRSEFDSLLARSPFTFLEKEKIFGVGGNEEDSILFKFLKTEILDDSGFYPKFFEVSFGRLRSSGIDEGLSSAEPVARGKVKLRGKIDRIDLDEKEALAAVVDYKTGGYKPTLDDLRRGLSLQLPVYIHAASELLSRKKDLKPLPHSFYIYSLKFSEKDFGRKKIRVSTKRNYDDVAEMEEQIETTFRHIEDFVEKIAGGVYHLSDLEDRDNKVCRYCSLITICRIKEVN